MGSSSGFASRTGAVSCIALALLASACTTSGLGLRGVGSAAATAQAPLEANEEFVSQVAAEGDPVVLSAGESTQEGVTMNLVAEEVPPEQSQTPARAALPPAPEMALTRDDAIRQIRAKADSLESEKPDVFAERPSSIAKMSQEELDALKGEMAESAKRNAALFDKDEAKRKALEMRELRRKARTHYKDAVKKIENQ